MAKASNVTKYTNEFLGNNQIADGYIKTTEQIWMDNYTIAFTNTNTTIDIAVLPPNKKIVGVDVCIYTTISQTNGTVSIGFNSDASVNTLMAPFAITHNLTRTDIALPAPGLISAAGPATVTSGTNVSYGRAVIAGLQKVTSGTQVTVAIKLNNWTMTTGSIYTIVRYT